MPNASPTTIDDELLNRQAADENEDDGADWNRTLQMARRAQQMEQAGAGGAMRRAASGAGAAQETAAAARGGLAAAKTAASTSRVGLMVFGALFSTTGVTVLLMIFLVLMVASVIGAWADATPGV